MSFINACIFYLICFVRPFQILFFHRLYLVRCIAYTRNHILYSLSTGRTSVRYSSIYK